MAERNPSPFHQKISSGVLYIALYICTSLLRNFCMNYVHSPLIICLLNQLLLDVESECICRDIFYSVVALLAASTCSYRLNTHMNKLSERDKGYKESNNKWQVDFFWGHHRNCWSDRQKFGWRNSKWSRFWITHIMIIHFSLCVSLSTECRAWYYTQDVTFCTGQT